MKTYLIYHILGKKIGCTSDLYKRMSEQGFTQWEILEEHNDIHEASDREIKLQKDYGYKVDTSPYWQSVQNRKPWNSETRNPIWLDIEHQSNAGKANKGIPRSSGGRYWNKLKTCIHCGFETTSGNIGRWHNDNCKHKKTLTN